MKFLLHILILFSFFKVNAQTFLNFTENGRWGVLDENGQVVLVAKFSNIENFKNGLAPAQSYGKWGLIDAVGNTIVPFDYFQMKLLPMKRVQGDSIFYLASKETGFGLINTRNEPLTDFVYREIEVSNSNYIGRNADELYYLGELGKGVLLDSGLSYMYFDQDLIQARFNKEKLLLNTSGVEVIRGKYEKFQIVNNCIIAFKNDENSIEIYDKEGVLLMEEVTFVNLDGYLVKLKDNKDGVDVIFNSIKNKELYRGEVNSVDFFGEYVIIETDSNYSIQDENGERPLAQSIKKYTIEDALLLLYENDSTFTIYDAQLSKIAGPGIELISFQKGFHWIRKDDKYGLIKNNKKIIPTKYENIQILKTTIKGYPKKGVDIYTFDSNYNLEDLQSFTNVIGINSKLEVNYDLSNSSNNNEGPDFGWYEDSIYSNKFNSYIDRWGVKCSNIDTACIKPVYVDKTPMNREYTQASFSRLSEIVPKTLPTVKGFPYRQRFDVVSNQERIIVNEIPFFYVDLTGYYSGDFTYCLSSKGPVLLDTAFKIMDNQLDYFHYGPKNLNAYCTGSKTVNYMSEDDKTKYAVSAENWWRRLGGVIRGTNKVSHGPPNKYVEFENAKWGYLDDQGNEVHVAAYDMVHEFDGSSGVVELEGKKGAVNNDTLIVPVNFSQVNYFDGTKDTLLLVTSLPSSNYFMIDSLADATKSDFEVIFKSGKKELHDYIPIKKNGKYGLINRKGEVIIEPVFKRKPIVEEKFLLVKEKKYGLYDFEGNQLTEPVFKKIEDYNNGLVVFEKSNKFGVAKEDGEVIIPASYIRVAIGNSTIHCVSKFGSKVYNLEGEVISKKKSVISDFDETTATWVEVKKTTTKVYSEDKSVNFKLKKQFTKIEFFNGFFKVEYDKNNYQVKSISETFDRITDGYDDIQMFGDSLFLVTRKKKQGLLSIAGEVIMSPIYREIIEVFDGVYAGVASNSIDVYDGKGNRLLQRRGKHVYVSDNDLFLIQTNNGYEFINREMENPFYVDFENAEPFAGEYASISERGKWCVINKFGEELFEKSYSFIKPIASNIFYAQERAHYGLYNLDGSIIAEPIYDKINLIDTDIIQVVKEGKIGYIRCDGSWVFNPF